MKNEIGFKEFKKVVRNKIRPVAFDLVKLLFLTDHFLRPKTTWASPTKTVISSTESSTSS